MLPPSLCPSTRIVDCIDVWAEPGTERDVVLPHPSCRTREVHRKTPSKMRHEVSDGHWPDSRNVPDLLLSTLCEALPKLCRGAPDWRRKTTRADDLAALWFGAKLPRRPPHLTGMRMYPSLPMIPSWPT